MKKFISKLVVRIFWSSRFDVIRRHHYQMAYNQGKFDQNINSTFNEYDKKFIQMEELINED